MKIRFSRFITLVLIITFAALFPALSLTAQNTKAAGDNHWDNRFGATNSPNGPVYAIFVKDTNVYIGGSFTQVGSISANNIARWDGHQWHALGDGVNSGGGTPCVYAITADNLNNVYAGGMFFSAGSVSSPCVAQWNGSVWLAMGSGMNNEVRGLAVGSSGEIYAAGKFTASGSTPLSMIASWNGTDWSSLGSGISGTAVNSLSLNGSLLAAGGDFDTAGGTPAKNIAIWDGSSWAAAGSGTDSTVNSIVYKGSNLYAGGCFLHAGGNAANHFAKYYSGSWSAVDFGLDYAPAGISFNQTDVFAVSSIAGVGASNITKYDCCWDPLGSGLDTVAYAICVYGNDVWTGGPFSQAGGKSSVHFAHWNAGIDFGSGISENTLQKNSVLLFPNPAREKLIISTTAPLQGAVTIDIYNASGSLVYASSSQNTGGTTGFEVDIRSLRPGLYLVRLCNSNTVAVSRFVAE